MLMVAGIGIGVSVKEAPHAVAQDVGGAKKSDRPPHKASEADIQKARELVARYKESADLTEGEIQARSKELEALRKAKRVAEEAVRSQEAALALLEGRNAAANLPANASYLAVMVGGDHATHRFQVTEFGDDGKPIWTVVPYRDLVAKVRDPGPSLVPAPRFNPIGADASKPSPIGVPMGPADDTRKEYEASVKAIERYLKRARNDPAAPQTVRLFVEVGARLEDVHSAAQACKAAGFTQVRLTGCIPSAFNVRAGKSPGGTDMRYQDSTFELDKLLQSLFGNMLKGC